MRRGIGAIPIMATSQLQNVVSDITLKEHTIVILNHFMIEGTRGPIHILLLRRFHLVRRDAW